MMKQYLLSIFLLLTISNGYAQEVEAYELQRAKINSLLAERSAKFGQYDQSLNERTGIFGFQTKRDIKNSNEILREITLNDNEIFTQLKVLMDYKDLQTEQIKTIVGANAESISNYRKTIKELQDQNSKLTTSVNKAEGGGGISVILVFVFFVTSAVLGYLLFVKNKELKAYQTNAYGDASVKV